MSHCYVPVSNVVDPSGAGLPAGDRTRFAETLPGVSDAVQLFDLGDGDTLALLPATSLQFATCMVLSKGDATGWEASETWLAEELAAERLEEIDGGPIGPVWQSTTWREPKLRLARVKDEGLALYSVAETDLES